MNNLITKISSFLSTSLFFLSTPLLHSTTTRLFPSWLHKYACYIHFNLSRLIICYLTARDDKFGGVLLLPIRLPCGRPFWAKHWNAWTHWNVRTHKLKLCTLKTCTHTHCARWNVRAHKLKLCPYTLKTCTRALKRATRVENVHTSTMTVCTYAHWQGLPSFYSHLTRKHKIRRWIGLGRNCITCPSFPPQTPSGGQGKNYMQNPNVHMRCPVSLS